MKMPPRRAVSLAAFIVCLWALSHYGYDAAAETFGGDVRRWHYVLGAAQSFCGWLLVALACRHWLPVGASMGIAYDESLKFTCGGLKLYSFEPWITKPGEGLCDSLGVHVNFIGLALVTFFAVVILLTLKDRNEQSPAS